MEAGVAKKIENFFGRYPVMTFDKGQILIMPGDDPKHIYHLTEGHVRVYDVSYGGDEIVVNVFKPPAFFPMSWPVAQVPNRYFFETGEKTKAYLAPPQDVLEFVKDNPDVLLDLLARLYSGAEGLTRRMAHLMGGSARSRLLFELIIECHRFGKRQKNGSYNISLSESELGARSGLSRETVNRGINELKKLNLLSVKHSGIILNDINALESRLGTDL